MPPTENPATVRAAQDMASVSWHRAQGKSSKQALPMQRHRQGLFRSKNTLRIVRMSTLALGPKTRYLVGIATRNHYL
jgi:hypothetical protein